MRTELILRPQIKKVLAFKKRKMLKKSIFHSSIYKTDDNKSGKSVK